MRLVNLHGHTARAYCDYMCYLFISQMGAYVESPSMWGFNILSLK